MIEMIANHISARVPGTDNQFLINPYGMLYEEMTASSMIKIDIDGNILFNATEYGINQAGYVIHSAVHAARHDVDCVIHTHTLAGMAVSAMKTGLLPIAQSAMRFGDIAYHDYEGPALNLDERARLVEDLGDREAMILRNHGLLTVGPVDSGMLQQHVPARTRVPAAGHDAFVQHGNPPAARRSRQGNLRWLQTGRAPPLGPDRMAGAAAQARQNRSVVSRLIFQRHPH